MFLHKIAVRILPMLFKLKTWCDIRGRRCVAGQFETTSSTADRTCSPCPDGTFSTTQNAPACSAWDVCKPGQHTLADGTPTANRFCRDCTDGTFSEAPDQGACTPFQVCTPGSFQAVPGNGTANRDCQPCSDGWWTTGDNQPTCAKCPAGTAGKANFSCCPLRPRTSPFPEEKSILGVKY